MKRFFLINVKNATVYGSYSRRGTGWSFTPYVSSRRSSRKAHATRAAASLRYTTPYCVEIEAESPQEAATIAKARQEAFNAWKPCTNGCAHYDGQEGCVRGAAPSLARVLNFCAKYETKAEVEAEVETILADPHPSEPLRFA